ncbi:MAG: 3-deoxy-D-manno-octulosonic acid transferase [Pseudomonadota bacterium]
MSVLDRRKDVIEAGSKAISPAMTVYGAAATGAAIAALPLLGVICAISEKRRRTVFKRLIPSLSGLCPSAAKSLWIHALSVGEVLSSEPLIERLQPCRYQHPVCMTAATLSGHQIAAERFNGRVDALGYFPFDVPFSIKRAFRRINPALVVLVESDIWPGFMAEAGQRGVPVVLANARLSERSLKGYRRLAAVSRPMLRAMAHICCQSAEDADRFEALGVFPDRLSVTGSIKFDQAPPEMDDAARTSWRRRLGISAEAPVMLAASTHPGEEGTLLAAYDGARRRVPGIRLIIAPRDPRRGETLCQMAVRRNNAGILYSALEASSAPAGAGVVVVDRMGVLARLLALAQVAFIGGSLVPSGGHNPLEAAAHGVPVLLGPDMRDFQTTADWLVAGGGAVRVSTADDIAQQVEMLVTSDQGRRMGAAARGVFLRHRGAVARVMTVLDRVLAAETAGACGPSDARKNE